MSPEISTPQPRNPSERTRCANYADDLEAISGMQGMKLLVSDCWAVVRQWQNYVGELIIPMCWLPFVLWYLPLLTVLFSIAFLIHKRIRDNVDCEQIRASNRSCSKISGSKAQKKPLKPHHYRFKCHLCPKKFEIKYHLQRHSRKHSGEKPYKFKHSGCEESFTQLSGLQAHFRRHHQPDKPYKCKQCPHAFSDEESFAEHTKKHNKPYKCPHCSKAYKNQTCLRKHIQKLAVRTGEEVSYGSEIRS